MTPRFAIRCPTCGTNHQGATEMEAGTKAGACCQGQPRRQLKPSAIPPYATAMQVVRDATMRLGQQPSTPRLASIFADLQTALLMVGIDTTTEDADEAWRD